jgi:flagellar basal-body rod modification protein FlgD
MTGVNPVAPAGLTAAQPAGARGDQTLNQASFLRLMTAQVKSQDPFKPLDQAQMVAQLAQFSQVAGIGEMNQKLAGLSAMTERLDTIAETLAAHTALLARLTAPAAPTSALSTPGE